MNLASMIGRDTQMRLIQKQGEEILLRITDEGGDVKIFSQWMKETEDAFYIDIRLGVSTNESSHLH